MVQADPAWSVNRIGDTILVDMTSAAHLAESDIEEIVATADGLLDDESVSIMQVVGVSTDETLPKEFASASRLYNCWPRDPASI